LLQAVFERMGCTEWVGLSTHDKKVKSAPYRKLIKDTWARLKKYNTKAVNEAANASRAAVLDTKHERTNRVRCSARMRDVLPALYPPSTADTVA
jgi:hypothetical protein